MMYKKISRSKEILSMLPKSEIQITREQIEFMNKEMEEVRRDFRMKSALSEISASKVILT